MRQHSSEFAIKAMARVLGVSRAGYYEWRDRPASQRALSQRKTDAMVRSVFEQKKHRYGAVRIARELNEEGRRIDKKTVANSLKRQGLVAKAARKFKATTNSNHSLPVAPNRLQQDFSASAPDEKWVGDLTYLDTGEGWLYLAVLIDLYSRRVVGWAMGSRMTADLACNALNMALYNRGNPKGVIVHSDRGSQYCSHAYQALLRRHKLVCSMSGRGNCFDNAVAESFFHSFKVEAIHGEQFTTRAQLKSTVFEYIEVDYNRTRRHSHCGYISPVQFEAKAA